VISPVIRADRIAGTAEIADVDRLNLRHRIAGKGKSSGRKRKIVIGHRRQQASLNQPAASRIVLQSNKTVSVVGLGEMTISKLPFITRSNEIARRTRLETTPDCAPAGSSWSPSTDG